VVTDEFPEFFLPRMLAAAGAGSARSGCGWRRWTATGSSPCAAAERAWPTAPHFRRMLQRRLPEHLTWFPSEDALAGARALPPLGPALREWLDGVRARWPAAAPALLSGEGRRGRAARSPRSRSTTRCRPVPFRGGARKGDAVLRGFVERQARELQGAPATRRRTRATAGCSPYLHWGFVSAHAVFRAVAEHEDWTPRPAGAEAQRQARGVVGGWAPTPRRSSTRS
jgi:deoxyribodipyrimidine photo-lyase